MVPQLAKKFRSEVELVDVEIEHGRARRGHHHEKEYKQYRFENDRLRDAVPKQLELALANGVVDNGLTRSSLLLLKELGGNHQS